MEYGVVLIDDLRSFKLDIDAKTIRTIAEAIEWLESLTVNDTIEQLWLDHDLGLDETGKKTDIMPFVKLLERKTFFDEAPVIKEIVVHTSNPNGGDDIVAAFKRFYKVKRVYAPNFFEAH